MDNANEILLETIALLEKISKNIGKRYGADFLKEVNDHILLCKDYINNLS